jgi:hypothetical protein
LPAASALPVTNSKLATAAIIIRARPITVNLNNAPVVHGASRNSNYSAVAAAGRISTSKLLLFMSEYFDDKRQNLGKT